MRGALALWHNGVLRHAGTEIAAGAIGRFWRLVGNETVEVQAREDFLSFDERGYAKAAISFLVRPERGAAASSPRPASRARAQTQRECCCAYWRAIRPGSGAIRRSWLAAIRRRAVGAAD